MPASEDESEDDLRPRGFLSASDRRYLRDPEGYAAEYSRQSVADRQRALHDRTRNALLDFVVLFEELDEDARKEIFGESGHELYRLHAGMVAAAAFFYEIHEVKGWDFGDFLTRVADEMWGNHRREPTGKILTDDISWNPHLADRRAEERIYVTAKEKLARGEAPTNRELGVLMKWGGSFVDENLDVLRDRLQHQSHKRSRADIAEEISTEIDMFGPEYSIPPGLRDDREDPDTEQTDDEESE